MHLKNQKIKLFYMKDRKKDSKYPFSEDTVPFLFHMFLK